MAKKNGVKEKIYCLKRINQKNKLNDLSGSEWIFVLNSVEVTHYSTKGADGFAHHLRGKHPSPKPSQLMKKFVDFFTKEGQVVFDPFMGVGGALIACSLSNRKGIGVDLSKQNILNYIKKFARSLI
jgi:DNA modification methylase